MSQITNYTYDELELGQKASFSKHVTEQDVLLFSALSGDVNPVHLDEEFAAQTIFGGRIAHGMLTGAVISAAIAMEMPGPGVVYLGQSLRFMKPVMLGDSITVQLEITEKRDDKKWVSLACEVRNQDGEVVATGDALVSPSREKLTIESPLLPRFEILD